MNAKPSRTVVQMQGAKTLRDHIFAHVYPVLMVMDITVKVN